MLRVCLSACPHRSTSCVRSDPMLSHARPPLCSSGAQCRVRNQANRFPSLAFVTGFTPASESLRHRSVSPISQGTRKVLARSIVSPSPRRRDCFVAQRRLAAAEQGDSYRQLQAAAQPGYVMAMVFEMHFEASSHDSTTHIFASPRPEAAAAASYS